MRSRLDGAAGDPERCGGLLFRELEEVSAGEHVAIVVGQPLDGAQESLPALARERGCLGILAVRSRLHCRAQRQRGAPAAGAAAVSGLVRDDRQQPRAKWLTRVEAPKRTVGLDERVLCRLLGVGRIPCDYERGAEGERLIGKHKRLERD